MRAHWLVFLAAASAASCGGPGSGRVPEGNVAAKEADRGNDASTDERGRLHDRLADAIAPLTEPPFGTAAAVTGVLGSIEGTAALGTL